jgi:hypothetical protein
MVAEHPSDLIEAPSAFATEAARFRKVLAAGRSAVFLQLFDFLVERSNDQRAPKEVEIALALFGNDGSHKAPDAGVRVYVHRLRKRLDEFYSRNAGPRLQIPLGEYRIVLVPGSTAPPRMARPARSAQRPPPIDLRWLAGLALVMISAALAWWFLSPHGQPERKAGELRETALWRPIGGDAPALVVIGDAYMLAETENQRDIARLILEPGIRSRGDLGGYLKTHPEAFYKLYDLDLHYTPIGTATAAWNLLPAVATLGSGEDAGPHLVASSRLKLEGLESNDVVFVGRVSNLGILAAPLFEASGFRMGRAYNELVDQASGKRYAADVKPGRDRKPRIDYGLVAALPGPTGKHILIIAGIGDAAVQSMAALAIDPAQLRELARRTGAGPSFEALYEVRAMGNVALDRTLLIARSIRRSDTSH